MTLPHHVTITARRDGPIPGTSTVHAEIEGGATGDYTVVFGIAGTQEEIDTILHMSSLRMEAIEATKAGRS